MKPGPYFFGLGLAVGVLAASLFWWQKSERDVGARADEVKAEWRGEVRACQERLRAAGLE